MIMSLVAVVVADVKNVVIKRVCDVLVIVGAIGMAVFMLAACFVKFN